MEYDEYPKDELLDKEETDGWVEEAVSFVFLAGLMAFLYLLVGLGRSEGWIIVFGILYIEEVAYRVLYYRYAKYRLKSWMERIMEWLTLLPFLVTPFVLTSLFLNIWILIVGTLIALFLWLAIWVVYLEQRIHDFWW